MNIPLTSKSGAFQDGAALVVSLVMLLVITAIGVAVMGGSRLEWLMTNNSHLETDAFRNAEIALKTGLGTIANPPTTLPSPPTDPISTLDPQDLADVTKWNDGTITGIPVATGSGSAAYVREYLGGSEYNAITPLQFVNNNCNGLPTTSYVYAYVYRVWALGTNGKGAARLIQTTRSLINNQAPVAGLPLWIPGPPVKARLPAVLLLCTH